MKLGRAFWLSMNDRRVHFNPDDAKSSIENLAWAAEELRMWRDNTEGAPEKFLTDETYQDMMILCRGIPLFMSYIWEVLAGVVPGAGFRPKVISQDPLEKTFGNLRQRSGGTQNITVLGIAYNLRSINANVLNRFKIMLNIP